MASSGINGIGVTAMAAGGVLVWAGVTNTPLLDTFRALARGQRPQPATTSEFKPFTVAGAAPAATGAGAGGLVDIAASYKGRCYALGGGHGSPCPAGCMDCSGFVSCVLNRAGLLKGTLATPGLSKWGQGIGFAARQPGDVLVWNGGAGGGHCGLAIDATTMWHNPCTKCGGVQIGTYGATRTGRTTIVRRAKAA